MIFEDLFQHLLIYDSVKNKIYQDKIYSYWGKGWGGAGLFVVGFCNSSYHHVWNFNK